MNAPTLVAILTLLLALGGDVARIENTNVTDPQTRIEIHGEIATVRASSHNASARGGCAPTECGANHNQTLVRDSYSRTHDEAV